MRKYREIYSMLAPEYRNERILKALEIYAVTNVEELERLEKFNKKPKNTTSTLVIVPEKEEQPAVNLYLYYPENISEDEILPAIYFMHASGYISGNPLQDEKNLIKLSNDNKAVVISVEYRLATAAPYPADIDDACHGLKYVFDNASKLNINKNKIVIMGDSAGGGLAARLVLRNRDRKEFKLAGQILNSPMLDYRTGTDKSVYSNPYAGKITWTKESNIFGWNKLKGGKDIPEEEIHYFSPSMAKDLSNLPDTYIVVGALDLFADENIDYASRLLRSGVMIEFLLIPGVFHGFYRVNPDSPQSKLYETSRNEAIQRMFNKFNK